MKSAQIEHAFRVHNVGVEQGVDMVRIRLMALRFAREIDFRVLDSREKSIALTKLEEVMFWANAGIAREVQEGEFDGEEEQP